MERAGLTGSPSQNKHVVDLIEARCLLEKDGKSIVRLYNAEYLTYPAGNMKLVIYLEVCGHQNSHVVELDGLSVVDTDFGRQRSLDSPSIMGTTKPIPLSRALDTLERRQNASEILLSKVSIPDFMREGWRFDNLARDLGPISISRDSSGEIVFSQISITDSLRQLLR